MRVLGALLFTSLVAFVFGLAIGVVADNVIMRRMILDMRAEHALELSLIYRAALVKQQSPDVQGNPGP